MGTLRLSEPEPRNRVRVKGLGSEQVPITLSRRDVSKHGEQFVTHTVKPHEHACSPRQHEMSLERTAAWQCRPQVAPRATWLNTR